MPRAAAALLLAVLLVTTACAAGTNPSLAGSLPASSGPTDARAASAAASAAVTSTAVAETPGESAGTSVAPASPAPTTVPSIGRVDCAESARAGSVAVRIEDFDFSPAAIQAKAGQVIRFTNTGFESHNATVDGGGCKTRTLKTGEHDGLLFTTAGSHPFHCTIHTWMTGVITIVG